MVTDAEAARRNPELAVLSAPAHGGEDDAEPVLRAMFAAIDEIDLEHAKLYTDLAVMVLPAAAKACLEEIMTTAAQEHGSEFASAYLPKTFARGEAKGRAEALLVILDTRSIDIPDDLRDRIASCTDIEQLDAWIRRAATALQAEDLFGR